MGLNYSFDYSIAPLGRSGSVYRPPVRIMGNKRFREGIEQGIEGAAVLARRAPELELVVRSPEPPVELWVCDRAYASVNATFPTLASNDKPKPQNGGSSPREFAQHPDLDKIDSWSSRRS